MADIIVLPGVERRDLSDNVPTDSVLLGAIEMGVTDAIVIGRNRAGEFFLASAPGDTDKVVGMLMRAVAMLSEAVVEPMADEENGG